MPNLKELAYWVSACFICRQHFPIEVFNLSIRRFCADNLHRCHPNRQIVQSATGTNVATETSPDPIKSSRSPNPDGPSATVTVAMASGESDSKATTATYGSIDPARAVQQQQQSLKRTRRRSESPFISTTTSGGLNVAEGMAERKEEKRKRWLRQRRRLIIYNVFFAYLWTCNTFIYYGLSLFSTKLAGNIYWNFVLVGAMEIPSYIVSPYLLDKLGRRWFVALSHFLATCSYCAIVINDLSSSLGFGPRCPSELVTLLMWLLGKFAISCSFTSLFVYASEVFPTVSRTTSIGICVSTSRIGACLVPIVQKISREWQLGSFGIAALLATFVTLLLPETRNKLLPASSAEVPKKSAELARQQSVVPVPSSTAASTT